jgi:glutaredoxin
MGGSAAAAAAAGGATQLTSERFVGSAKVFDDAVRAHKGVLVFSKTTCPYCDRVKKALDTKSIPYAVVELDRVDKAPELRTELTRLSGIVMLDSVPPCAAFFSPPTFPFSFFPGFLFFFFRRTRCPSFSLVVS